MYRSNRNSHLSQESEYCVQQGGQFELELLKIEVSETCNPPIFPRQRQIPRRIDDGIAQHVFTSVEDHYRKEYFEVIDAVHGELQRRFLQKNFYLLEILNNCCSKVPIVKHLHCHKIFVHYYENDIDMQKLLLHLQMHAPHDRTQSREVRQSVKYLTIAN